MKKYFVIFVYIVLISSTLLVFGQVRKFSFVNHDDNEYVYENPHVLKGLTADGVIWAFTANRTANWHPLTWLSLMLDCQLFSANPGYMHLVNLLFHLANTLLLFALLKKMTGTLWPSAFVAVVFALHPMHIESVAWISERKDVLSTLFFLLTLISYVTYVKNRGILRYLLTLLLFALGLLAKPMLVTLPFVLLLLDYWPLNRISNRQSLTLTSHFSLLNLIVEKIPFFALSIASSIITFLVQLKGYAVIYLNAFPLTDRIANAFISYARYIEKLFWPQNLAIFHPFGTERISLLLAAVCILILIAVSTLAIFFGRNQKYLPVGWFWFLGTLVPVIGFVQVGYQSYAERYTYIPYIGLFIMIAWGLPHLLSNWPQRKIALGLSMAISLTILGIAAHKQVSYWQNNFTLYSHAIKVTQNNFIAYHNLGVAYYNAGCYEDALDAYRQAIKIKPDYETYFSLGLAYGKLGRSKDEVDAFKQAIKIKHDYAPAYANLGFAYNTAGRYDDAIEMYKQAIKFKPDDADAYSQLSSTYAKLGRWQDAARACKEIIRIKPDDVAAHFNLALAYLASGDRTSALEQCKILKPLDPAKADELFKLINK